MGVCVRSCRERCLPEPWCWAHFSGVFPEALKSEGNLAFVEKNYEKAIEIYTEAIALCNTNHVRVGGVAHVEFLFAPSFEGVAARNCPQLAFFSAFVTYVLLEMTQLLFANRSAAQFYLGNFPEALSDALRSVEVNPSWTKVRVSGDSA